MAGNTNKKIYLDTCFIIDWLTLNQSSPDSMEIGGVINAILGNKINATTSIITKTEILECKNTDTMWKTWQRMQSLNNFQVVSFSNRISDCASEIRNFYQIRKIADEKNKKPPSVPDSIHIATAIICGVDVMFSSDAGKKDPKTLSPLELNGTIADKWNIRIERPKSNQSALLV